MLRTVISIIAASALAPLSGCATSALTAPPRSPATLRLAQSTPAPDDAHGAPVWSGPADAVLAAAVRRQLARGPVTEKLDLDVRADRGIVILRGSVPHVLAKRRAVERARLVVGVRAVSDRLTVASASIGDAELRDELVDALHADPLTRDEDIQVAVKGGVVTLSGTASSAQRRAQARRIAERGDGVTRVRDGLRVSYAFARADSAIRADVVSVLRWDPHIDADLTTVSVHGDMVTLSGFVGTRAERDREEEDAWVEGVAEVDSNPLIVNWLFGDPGVRHQPFPVRSDAQIANTIQDGAGIDPRLARSDVEPEVVAGVVTLMGQVSSNAARRAALSLARDTVGVIRVDDDLHVIAPAHVAPPLTLGWQELWPGWTSLRDGLAADQIRQELRWDPAVDAERVKVQVHDGHALLTGEVNSVLAIPGAERDAYDAGAVSVASQLRVAKNQPVMR